MADRKHAYVARFSYEVRPVHREKALNLILRETQAAVQKGRRARLLIPVTRAQGCAALQFEVELDSLDDLERFRQKGVDDEGTTSAWMREFDQILESPPLVEILRVAALD